MNEIDELLSSLRTRFIDQKKEIDDLKVELSKKEEIINSYPQLSHTSLGQYTTDGKIKYRNWFITNEPNDVAFCDNIWFTNFIKNRFKDFDYKINFFGIYGTHDGVIKSKMNGKKIFYTPESINKAYDEFNNTYGIFALDYVDLALGSVVFNHPKYFRIPYWLMRNFYPNFSEEDIENKVEILNSSTFEKSKDIALISSHDRWKTRSLIADDVEKYVKICYAGKWRNNTSELWEKYNNNKVEYLKQFKFNICSENGIDDGYITEKIFEAIQCDCVPLYIGGGNYMEPEVLNDKAILLWDFNKDNTDVIEHFKNLLEDEKSYNEFKEQNPLLDTSAKFIIKTYNQLEKQFEKIICDN